MATPYDVIIGSGAGGGTLARHLAPSGKRILLIERGGWLPREPENWDSAQVFIDSRDVSAEQQYPLGRGRALHLQDQAGLLLVDEAGPRPLPEDREAVARGGQEDEVDHRPREPSRQTGELEPDELEDGEAPADHRLLPLSKYRNGAGAAPPLSRPAMDPRRVARLLGRHLRHSGSGRPSCTHSKPGRARRRSRFLPQSC